MESVANFIVSLLYEHRYIFSFLGALLEGTYVVILAGVLYKFGFFKFWGVIAVLLSGYFLNGVVYYLIGRLGGYRFLEKRNRKGKTTSKILDKLEDYFKKHSVKTLFITRITYGLSWPTLVIAGSFKMKWKKFLTVNLVATIVWVLGVFVVGYVFGAGYEALGNITKGIKLGLSIFLFVIIVFASLFIVYWFRKLIKTKFVKKLGDNRQQFFKKIGVLINNLINNKNGKEK